MFRRIYDSFNPMAVVPICGVLYGLVRVAGAYTDSVEAGTEMTLPQIAGYLIGSVFVWGLAGLVVAWMLEKLDRRRKPKATGDASTQQRG